MDEEEVKTLIDFFQGEEVKIVWKEEESIGKPKVGHGKYIILMVLLFF